MKDLATEILNSPNEEVEYWSCIFENDSVLGKLHEYPPELIKISLKQILRDSLINDISSCKSYRIDSSYFNFRTVKTNAVTHVRCNSFGEIYIYRDKQSCIEAFNELVYQSLLRAKHEQNDIIERINRRIDRLERSFVNSDIIIETLKRSQ